MPNEVQGLVDTVNSFMVRLQSALDALRHFTGNASHQLRTPLAIIRTQLALAQRATTIEETRAAAMKADEAVANAERILAQLLLMAKIDAAGRDEARGLERVELGGLARAVTADHVPAAGEAGIDLGFAGEGEHWIRAEPLLVGELLKNLIGNALLYAGRGAEVTVRVESRDHSVLLEVEDNGPGIPPELREAALKRFRRGGEEAPGTGLGLPIVEEIAALYGGTMRLEEGDGGRGLKVVASFPAG